MAPNEFVSLLEHSLASGAAYASYAEQRSALAPLMQATGVYADRMARGDATWDPIRQWTRANAHVAIAAYNAFEAWSADLAGIFYGGGEKEAERALVRRSQLELVRDLFRGTAAEEVLAPITSEAVEADYRQAAEQLHLEAPSWVPRSHSWWYWRDK